MASSDEIRAIVIESLREFVDEQEVDIDDGTDPIRQLGLDSEDGVAIACALSERLGFNIPDDINPLVDDSKHKARKVREIVHLLHSMSVGE